MSKGALKLVSPAYSILSGGSKAPKAYTPTWQQGADQTYQNVIQNATPWATGLPGQVVPGLQDVVGNVQNNPYYPGAQQGANDVSALATDTVAPGMMGSAAALWNQGMSDLGGGYGMMGALMAGGDLALHQGRDIYGRTMEMMPGAVFGGYKEAMPFYRSGMQKANTAWDTAMGAIPGLTGGMPEAQRLLDNGFDPQSALYDREFQKMQDQQNAINAMYGLSSSAYGAGLAGDSARDFNLDWQDRSLGRQLSALRGYGAHAGQVTNNLTNLIGTGSDAYNGLSQGAVAGYNSMLGGAVDRGTRLMDTASTGLNRGIDNQRLNYATGAQIHDTFNRGAADMMGAASSHAADALNTLYTSTQLPNQTYLQNQDAQIAALQALAQGTNSALMPSMNLGNLLSDYMRLGQSATQINQNARQMDQAAQAAGMQSLMKLAGFALAPMTGGMSLFGSLAGGLGGALGGAGALTSSMGPVVSDRRMKTGIVRINTRPDGAGVYSFRYRGEKERRIGVMAQEMLKVRPDVVVRRPDGILAVDYGKLAA